MSRDTFGLWELSHIYSHIEAIYKKVDFHENWNLEFIRTCRQMNFGVEVAMTHGYLETKNERDPCRDKIYPGQNVQNLPRAVDVASLNISKKFLFRQNPWVHTYKSCSYRFFP